MAKTTVHPKPSSYTLPLEVFKEGGWYIAQCPALDLASQGRTAAKAIKAMEDAVGLFMEELRDLGTLEDVLTECKWRKVNGKGGTEAHFVPPASEHRDLKIRPIALHV